MNNSILFCLLLIATMAFAEEHNSNSNNQVVDNANHKLLNLLSESGSNDESEEDLFSGDGSSENDDVFGKRAAKYRYGKRSAMPYRFGRKRSWNDANENFIYVRMTPQEYLRYKQAAAANAVTAGGEDMFGRATYRYGK